MLKYDVKDMQNALQLLNSLEVKGIENCKRVAVIAQIIDAPVEHEDKGEQDNGGIQ